MNQPASNLRKRVFALNDSKNFLPDPPQELIVEPPVTDPGMAALPPPSAAVRKHTAADPMPFNLHK